MAQSYGVSTQTLTVKTLVGKHPAIQAPITLLSNGSTEIELEAGTVLAKVTASGKFVGLDPDGADGSEAAVCILAEDITVPATGDEKSVAYVHGSFIESELVWTHDGITAGEQATALAELKALSIFME